MQSTRTEQDGRNEANRSLMEARRQTILERLTANDVANLYDLARAVQEVVAFDRGRCSGHGWEEMIAAYDAYWQERAHPFDDTEPLP